MITVFCNRLHVTTKVLNEIYPVTIGYKLRTNSDRIRN